MSEYEAFDKEYLLKVRFVKRNQDMLDMRENTAAQLLSKYPNLEIERDEYSTYAITYIPSYYNGKIHIYRSQKIILNKVFSLDSKFLTKKDARQAIEKHIPAALEKFDSCRAAIEKLERTMNFTYSYTVEGDTTGVEHFGINGAIGFEIEGFSFLFEVR